MSTPNIYTVPPGLPFLRTLADAILAGHLPAFGGAKPSPISLAGYTLLLPTRRATRALQEAFLAASGGHAMLMPKIRPIGEGVEELTLLAGAAGLGDLGPDSAEIPPAMSELQRRLVLTELVMQWSKALRQPSDDPAHFLDDGVAAGANTPAQAAKLATELARLIDMVETEGASLAGLDTLVPEDFSEHWKKTLEFLEIVVTVWPQYLAAHERLSPMDRRNRVLRLEAGRLSAMPPTGPVIVAGVTGSIPAAAALMQVIAKLPNGAIVLPGLDQAIDDESFGLIAKQHPDHPQFGLSKLLTDLGVGRRDVAVLGALPQRGYARAAMLGEALRPAATTDRWHDLARAMSADDAVAALAGVHLITTPTAQDEAEVAALILRKAIETPGRTAALISPDRVLARRVGVRLAAMGIQVDDSAGRPFGKTVTGAFLDLTIEAAAKAFAPAATMALLKHPLTRLGMSARDIRRAARYLELGAFRTLYLGRGLDGIDMALERAAQESVGDSEVSVPRSRAVRRLWEADWQAARALVAALKGAYAPWAALDEADGPQPLQTLARAHVDVAEALARLPDETDADASLTETTRTNQPLWDGEAGIAGQAFFTGLLDPELRAPSLVPVDYADFYRGLIAGENVRPRHALHPRVFIWGPFEARLQQPDIVVLGSLNDGTWPEAADPGPWLNRPMRAQLGLPSPEERIGAMAHDFTQLLGAETVYMTRAEKVSGVPTVPSRWLMRLSALLDGLKAQHALSPDEPWLAWARAREVAGKGSPVSAPAPCPAVKLRPRKLSVTSIERWLANPYAIFAQHVLELEALPELGTPPDARLRGAIIHDALSRFAKRHPDTLPPDIADALSHEAAGVLATFAAHPRIAAFWRPRFDRFADWFGETESARRVGVTGVVAEVTGKHVIAAPFAPFTLTARADRFDISDSGLAIYDYKTGNPPSAKAVESGQSPQLLLEAMIARVNGFGSVPALPVKQLTYIRATGGEPPGKETSLKIDNLDAVLDRTSAGLAALVAAYDDVRTPYRALRRASLKNAYAFDDFAHLARVAEWSGGEDDGEETSI